ncbi:MAG TPA: glycine--tRNA ligase subunit beta [Caulobacteraceae bacterium]|nr:glycine--tRNA ligase subunit beta [Caulobacteraceae bacterium]
MAELLIEILSEEIPARMQAQAARDFERMTRERLAAAGLLPGDLKTFAGPRRLTLVADGLPAAQSDRREELKGPKTSAPEQALEGFLRKTGLTREQLTERDGVWFAVIEKAGRPTPEIVAEMVEDIVRAFPWPKSMTWGTGKLRWVRPLRRILCVFDREVVRFAVDGIESGDISEGHRFMGSGKPFRARDFDEYREALAGHYVVLDVEERKQRILEGARTLCFARNLELVEDEGLLEEVAGLAEWPAPILGDMDPGFLDLPAEVIRTSMRTHQKYFAVKRAGEMGLAPHFISVANIEAPDGGRTIAAGNAKVLSARLSDARFFWDEDRKVPLEDWLEKLKGVTFHAKLGTMYERVERIGALAREIAPLVGADPDIAAKAARLAKADLATGMVGEFPELQGLMGGYYARQEPYAKGSELAALDPERDGYADGTEDPMVMVDKMVEVAHEAAPGAWHAGLTREVVDQIADAVRDHYKPQGPNDAVPTAPVSVAVALADKLDTLVGFFAIDEKPTGSKDPYALRRAALGIIRTILDRQPRISLGQFAGADLLDFFADRLKVTLRDQGKRHDLVDAVFALGDDDLVRIVARVEALDGFLKTDDGANLLAGYKRAVNILKAEEKKGVLPSGEATRLPSAPTEETALLDALQATEPKVQAALEREDFTAAMTALAALRAPVDAFFDKVLVNSPDPQERENRLKLLGNVRDAMGRVADFSLISG